MHEMPTTSVSRFSKSDRALMVVSDATIHGSTRLQKYGFLLAQQYKKEMNRIAAQAPDLQFYKDWEPLWFGPFSKELSHDIEECVNRGLIYKEHVNPTQNLYRYGFTIQGRIQWRAMLREFGDEMTAVREKVVNLQKVRLERLLEGIYNAYPKFTERSVIKDRFPNST